MAETTLSSEPVSGYLLIRSEEWAHLYNLWLDATMPNGVRVLEALKDHFEGAYLVGEPAGEVFYVPAEGKPIIEAHVVTEMTPYDDNDYARRYIKIMAGTDVLATVSHRVDGRA